MKQIRKSLLTLLALTLFGGAGAWAQGPTQVTQFTTDMIAGWQGVNENLTLADLQDLGFEAVDENTAAAWTGAPQEGDAFLFYDFNEGIGTFKFIWFDNGNVQTSTQTSYTKSDFYNEVANGFKYFYTGSPAVIELTKTGANQWTLAQTPDYDVEVQVEYYGEYTLDSIPLGWQVKVGNAAPVHPTAYTEGNTTLGHLTITETDSVELIPANPRRVKSVTLVDNSIPPTVDLDNTTTAWTDGNTFAVPAGGLTYSDAITVEGNVTLVLTDGETLTLNKGISIAEGATLTVEGNGTMNVNGTNNSTASTVAGTGTLVLTSGTLTAKGGNGRGVGEYGDGINNSANAGGNAINGNVTVSGGTLTATGGNGGGVGGGSSNCYGAVGGVAISGSLTINAGTVTTTNGAAGSVGSYCSNCSGGAAGAAVAGTVTDNRN